jgi:hypothetical protein
VLNPGEKANLKDAPDSNALSKIEHTLGKDSELGFPNEHWRQSGRGVEATVLGASHIRELHSGINVII